MTNPALTEWVILLLTISQVIAMGMLPFILRLVVKMELEQKQNTARLQEQIDKLDAAVSLMAPGALRNDRIGPYQGAMK